MFQNHSQVFERLHPLYTLRLVLTCEAEGHLRALARDRDVPPTPLHLSVPVAPLRLMVLDQPPLWHVHITQAEEGQRLPTFLNHRYTREKVSAHEIFPQPARAMRYFRTNCHRESHCLQHPGEQNHIGNPPRPPISTSLVYGMLLPCCLPT